MTNISQISTAKLSRSLLQGWESQNQPTFMQGLQHPVAFPGQCEFCTFAEARGEKKEHLRTETSHCLSSQTTHSTHLSAARTSNMALSDCKEAWKCSFWPACPGRKGEVYTGEHWNHLPRIGTLKASQSLGRPESTTDVILASWTLLWEEGAIIMHRALTRCSDPYETTRMHYLLPRIITPRDRHYLHFIDEVTKTQRLRDFPKPELGTTAMVFYLPNQTPSGHITRPLRSLICYFTKSVQTCSGFCIHDILWGWWGTPPFHRWGCWNSASLRTSFKRSWSQVHPGAERKHPLDKEFQA